MSVNDKGKPSQDASNAALEWQTTFDATNDAIWVLDKDSVILRSNRTASLIFNRPAEEIIGRHCWEIVHGTKEPIPECPVLRMKKSLRRETMPLKIKEHYFEVTVDPILDEKGQFSGSVHTVADVTERKRIEQSLRESEEKYRLLFENMSSGFALHEMIYDKAGNAIDYRYIEVNPAFEKLTGIPAGTILGRTVLEVMPGTEKYWIETYAKVAETGVPISYVNYSRELNKHFDAYSFSPKKGFFAVVFQDVTEHKKAVSSLRENQRFLSDIIENSGALIFVKDLKGCYKLTNRKWEEATGLTREKVIGKTDEMIFRPEIARDFRLADLKAIEAGTAIEQEEILEDERGKKYFLSVKFPMRKHDGEISGVCGIATDITERKMDEQEKEKLQAQLVQAQKMESVGRLAGGVAHDFNNMLAAILGYTEMSLKHVDAESKIYPYLKETQRAAERSASLTKQLLAFARKQDIIPRLLDVNSTVAGMLKMLQRIIGENISLNWNPAPDLWPVMMDPSQIDQILANLCVNSRDAISGVGKIVISTENLSLDKDACADWEAALPGDYVMLSVSDSGCGMSPELISHLFEPFFTTKDIGKGTGLGLATIYGIVQQNNGLIKVLSKPGQGTCFKLCFPRHFGEPNKEEFESSGEHASYGHERILVVEDEHPLLELNKEILESLGYCVLAAESPKDALLLAAKEPKGSINLLLTDVIMPEMNGRQLSRKITSLHPEIKCLFMSGYTANVVMEEASPDESINFLQKPFTIAEVSSKVREVLDAPLSKKHSTQNKNG